MKSELLTQSPLLGLPLLALAIFLSVFIGTIVLMVKRGSAAYAPIARLPLDDEAATDAGETP